MKTIKNKMLLLFFLVVMPFSMANSQQSYVEDIDFVHYIQYEIKKCVNNMKQLTSNKGIHDILVEECAQIVTSANRLGKLEFTYENANNESFEKKIEGCSENLKTKNFINCIYENN